MKRIAKCRRAAVANVVCAACARTMAGVVVAKSVPGDRAGLLEVCLDCLDDMFDAAKLLQMRLRRSVAWARRADYGPDWTAISQAITNRDDRSCQDADHRGIAGADLGESLVVHHIRPLKEFDGDYISANQPENLITLCTICHGRWHSALTRAARQGQRV